MEVIQLAGYTEEEKLQIAKRYLVPRQIERNGLEALADRASPTTALRAIIADYTREAGVRNLEREIGTVCRKVARQVAEGTLERKVVGQRAERVRELLGRPRFYAEVKRRTHASPAWPPGLAWTPVGGDVLFVEATAMPGTGKLTITGQLGDVMRSPPRPRCPTCAATRERRARPRPTTGSPTHDVHVHVPAGAIPKDGPSAGITMATALVVAGHRAARCATTWR